MSEVGNKAARLLKTNEWAKNMSTEAVNLLGIGDRLKGLITGTPKGKDRVAVAGNGHLSIAKRRGRMGY